ncbi:MAG: alkaline phosphatase [Candidatus Marinimicrobia bacterium]|nr:alkaline phosphatase [Candidatus Neomarinimicrobiota bacterium]
MNYIVVRILLLLLSTTAVVSGQRPAADDLPVGPKSIILIIADGMGIGQHTMAYYYTDRYAPAAFDHVGLMTTHPADSLKVTDSGAAATAMATGYKTYYHAIGVDENKRPLKTVLEYALEKGMATGLITTTWITDATPAAFATHSVTRDNHKEIARQMSAAGIDVLLGGGRQSFIAKEQGGIQDINLLDVMASQGVQIISSLDEITAHDRPVVGLFAMGDLPDAPQRTPTLTQMALKAIDILDDDPDGFFIMIEEEMTDSRSHENKFEATRVHLVILNDLIEAVLAYQSNNPQVLVLFIADHETGGWFLEEKGDRPGKPRWTTRGHTGNLVPIFASGPGSEAFDAVVDNTFIGKKLIEYVTGR